METFNRLLVGYPRLVYSGFGASAFLAGGALIYRIATRKKPTHANVNCWFCNENTVVPYVIRNSWDCPSCEQYNGFQENGDYNKPILAQYNAQLNYSASGNLPSSDTPPPSQWVNSQMLLCKRCNKNQSVKIKQLASFIPKDDDNYDEEIEAYKHHLEQTYKLCRPCQTVVEYYIKYQNRQLRTVLLNHQQRRIRESDTCFIKSSSSMSSTMSVIILRALTFLICAYLVATSLFEFPAQPVAPTGPQTLSGGVVPPKPQTGNESAHNSSESQSGWLDLLQPLHGTILEQSRQAWQCGRDNPMLVVSAGMMTCLTAIFLAGPGRLRGIDAFSLSLWVLSLILLLAEGYLGALSGWLDTLKLTLLCVCCLFNFTAAAVTRKPQSYRRARYRRYLAGGQSDDMTECFIPTPPHDLFKLINRHNAHQDLKASPCALSGRLSRALRFGPRRTLTRTDSGYLFSGSRPAPMYKDSTSDYFSLKSVSHPSSPCPSPTHSIAESVISSSGSLRRRPLIYPARLNISGQKQRPFSPVLESTHMSPPPSLSHFPVEPSSSVYNECFSPIQLPLQSHNGPGSVLGDQGGIGQPDNYSSSSRSSACQVGTTTQGPEGTPPPKGLARRLIWPGLLFVSLTSNLFFSGLYIYYNWR